MDRAAASGNDEWERILAEACAFVARESGVARDRVDPDTRLVEDLGIDGDDGHDLLAAFAREFGVAMDHVDTFNYFDDEPPMTARAALVPVVARISPRWRERLVRAGRGRRTIRPRDLAASVRAGTWIVPAAPREDADLTRADGSDIAWIVALGIVPVIFLLIRGLGDPLGWLVVAVSWAILLAGLWMSLGWIRRLERAQARQKERRG